MVGNHKLIGYTKFAFVSSSICEGSNFNLKYGVYRTTATQSIVVSGTRQLKQVAAKTSRDNVKLARNIQSDKLWSRLSTSKFLTDFMEGLMCDLFDKCDYEVIYVGNKSWHVFYSSILREHNLLQNGPDNKPVPRFDRVRIVTLDGSC